MLRLSGTDRYGHIANLAKYAEGKLVFDVPLVPAGVPRLRNLAASYQRIRWRKIVLRFEPMVPSITVGGFVCGFIPDADDSLENGNPLDRLMSHPGSKMVKAWQAATVVHSCAPDLLYTSRPAKAEARLYSPGRVALVIDSKISAGKDTPAPMSIYLDWEVELHEPSLEADSPKATSVECQESFYARSSNVGLWWKDEAGGDDPRSVIPGIQLDVVYRSGSKRFVSFVDSAGGTLGNFDRFRLVQHPTHGITLFVVDYAGKDIENTADKNYWILEKGDILVPEPKNSLTGLEHLRTPSLFASFGPRPSQLSRPSAVLDLSELEFPS